MVMRHYIIVNRRCEQKQYRVFKHQYNLCRVRGIDVTIALLSRTLTETVSPELPVFTLVTPVIIDQNALPEGLEALWP
jgi:hypothetical protein